MIDLIKGRFDVKLNHPVILPAPFSGDSNCLFCRSTRSISIGIRMKDRVEYRLDDALDDSLYDSIRHSGDDGFIMHLPPIALRIRRGFGLKYALALEAFVRLFR
jgi:hypothetical protein